MPETTHATDESQIRTLRLEPSFGFGDRTGLATPGHVAAMKKAGAGISPIFPQQSIREMSRTGRTASQVMRDAVMGMKQSGWTAPSGADADHLKTTDDIDVTFSAGFCFYTLDPSDHVDTQADDDSESVLREKFHLVKEHVPWIDAYLGKSIQLSDLVRLEFSEEACLRAAVKYGRAIQTANQLAEYLAQIHRASNREYEVELSVDETPHPTTLVEHYIVAEQLLSNSVPLVSIAPRFPGDFEKGVDYKGDRAALETSLRAHAAIANELGPYKLSLHSGSDKLSMYRSLAAATDGRFHVKTAGTSYLEALRVAARHDEALFRQIVDYSRRRFEADKATYHLSATLDDVPPPSEVDDVRQLESLYLEQWDEVPVGCGFRNPGRQIVHCTFGSILADARLGTELKDVLRDHQATYNAVLEDHFARHLGALQEGM